MCKLCACRGQRTTWNSFFPSTVVPFLHRGLLPTPWSLLPPWSPPSTVVPPSTMVPSLHRGLFLLPWLLGIELRISGLHVRCSTCSSLSPVLKRPHHLFGWLCACHYSPSRTTRSMHLSRRPRNTKRSSFLLFFSSLRRGSHLPKPDSA